MAEKSHEKKMSMNSKISDKEQPAQSQHRTRPALEYGPLILFFITNYFAGIMWGTAVLVAATAAALVLSWLWDRKIPMMALFGGIAVAFFGGLTLFFEDEFFIKIKPTVISLLIAAILAGGQLIGRNPLKAMLSGQLQLSRKGWQQVTWIWVLMFVVSAAANELAWRSLSTDGWVTFKAFGLTGISLVFALLTIPVMKRHGALEG